MLGNLVHCDSHSNRTIPAHTQSQVQARSSSALCPLLLHLRRPTNACQYFTRRPPHHLRRLKPATSQPSTPPRGDSLPDRHSRASGNPAQLSHHYHSTTSKSDREEAANLLQGELSLGRGHEVSIEQGNLQRMPALDVRDLSTEQIAGPSKLFDEIADSGFEGLPAMVDCPTRSKLDDGLANILGLPAQLPLRRLIASEPVVSCRRL